MEYKTEECIVAFIDILGATEKIKENPKESLNIVHKAYDDALELLSYMYRGELEDLFKPKAKIFSDNIVVSVSISNHKAGAFMTLCAFLALLQTQFLMSGYLVRGGIASGEFFADDIMVWGDALVKAYIIESEIAIYPRIVVHPDLVEDLKLSADEKLKKYLIEDSDGLIFIDYILNRVSTVKENKEFMLKKFYDDCEKMIEKNKNNIKVMQKIQWHYTYLQSCIVEFAEEMSGDGNA